MVSNVSRVWKPDESLALVFEILHETLSRVVDVSSQSKQKLKSKRRSKIVKIYPN